jgi:hypothetical protein
MNVHWEISGSKEIRYWVDDQGSIPGIVCNFSLHYWIQTGSVAHPASDSMGIGGCDKVAAVWTDHSPPTNANNETARGFASNPLYIIMHEA